MHIRKALTSIALLTAIALPVAGVGQDHDYHHDSADHRYYDKAHRDYHRWDKHEDAAYRHWITEERHRKYVEFDHLRAEDQQRYWAWRHDHPDWH